MAALNRRSTARDAVRGVSLAGKHAIVTGASSGLGVETARALSQAGANVVLAVRDVAAGERLAGTLVGAGVGRVTVSPLDLSDLASVNAFVERHRGGPLDLLVNNAGIMATPLGYTRQGLELQLGTNHVGHVALTLGLLPTLEQSSGARVVTVSSALHSRGRGGRLLETLEQDLRYERRKYVPFDAYGDSKLANVLFTLELARRLPPQVRAFSLHPGVIPTPLSRSLGVGGVLFRTLGAPFMKSVAQGAATSVFAATAPELDLHSGAYLSDCAIAMPSREATDPELAERVWRATEAFIKAR